MPRYTVADSYIVNLDFVRIVKQGYFAILDIVVCHDAWGTTNE